MTKTLTEQWRDGELDGNLYYFKLPNGNITITSVWGIVDSVWKDKEDIIEVLAPVPGYDEWQAELASNDELLNVQKRLEKKLEIATKALKRYSKDDYYSEGGGRSVNPYPHIARKALKEMEGVK